MNRVAIPKTEYLRLRQQASAYQKLTQALFRAIVRDPAEDIVADFKKTGLYTKDFLRDLEDGLRKSSLGRL